MEQHSRQAHLALQADELPIHEVQSEGAHPPPDTHPAPIVPALERLDHQGARLSLLYPGTVVQLATAVRLVSLHPGTVVRLATAARLSPLAEMILTIFNPCSGVARTALRMSPGTGIVTGADIGIGMIAGKEISRLCGRCLGSTSIV